MRYQRILAVLLISAALSTGTLPAMADDPCAPGDHECSGIPETEGDQGAGSIVTTGVNFPNAEPGSDVFTSSQKNKNCKDCEWSIVPACLVNGPEDSGVLCMGAVSTCTDPAAIRYRVYMRQGDGPWVIQGTVCLGPDDRPATVADVGQAIRTRVVNYLPDASPSFQPRAGGIVNLPTVFSAGEPQTIRTDPFDVLGFTVVVTAKARWEWAFDEGVVQEFAVPGGAYPDMSVAYTYADPGGRQVTVTTYWRASFTVNGEGPFQVPGAELSKTAGPIAVPVREARSELIGG
jgi:hypothetical protein